MKFINDDPLKIFEAIDLKKTKRRHYKTGLLIPDQLTGIDIDNYQLVCKYAISQFDFLEKNENLSGYYLVDWRVIYAPLECFILQSKQALEQTAIVQEFMHKYANLSAEILYGRLGI